MGKNKLRKFAEMAEMACVFQCGARELLPGNPVCAMKGKWNESFFHNNHPIVLELGCGHGDYTVGLARVYPEYNFIGVDIKGARMWQGAKRATEEGLTNVAFLRTNIEMLPSFFAEDEVDTLWITFPDPQMKKATKRLTSTFFMERYRLLMRDGGRINLKTDSPFLYTYTQAMVLGNNLPVLCDTDDLYGQQSAVSSQQSAVVEDAKRLQTHYEQQWLERGMTIKYLSWQLPKQGILVEPEIEIEKDTYRSYGRNYVSKANN